MDMVNDGKVIRLSASLPSPQTSLRVSDDGCELRVHRLLDVATRS